MVAARAARTTRNHIRQNLPIIWYVSFILFVLKTLKTANVIPEKIRFIQVIVSAIKNTSQDRLPKRSLIEIRVVMEAKTSTWKMAVETKATLCQEKNNDFICLFNFWSIDLPVQCP